MEQSTQAEMQDKKKFPVFLVVAVVIVGLGAYYFRAPLMKLARPEVPPVEQTTEEIADDEMIPPEDGGEIPEVDLGDFTPYPEGEVSDKFPADLELYPGAEVKSSFDQKSDTIESAGVVLETTDTPEQVRDFYVSSLEKNGWEMLSQTTVEELILISAQKDARDAMVAVSQEEGVSTVSVSTRTE